ncbi:MAG TPA: pitrilysin family protein [Terriglobales bacterium]|nr:pitrilysin family protein [Terriglobales bacterium]
MVEITRLSNGITVLLENIDFYSSVSAGIYVNTGSRNELPQEAGISHFIEHMLFKGTAARSANDIARQFDRIGGQANAYTSKENTVFYAKTMSCHAVEALDIIADMVMNSKFDKKDISNEQGVVCEEINMVEDSPDDLVVDRLVESVWGTVGLGGPILGTAKAVNSFDKEAILAYMDRRYTTPNLIVSVAGSFDRADVMNQLENTLGKIPPAAVEAPDVSPIYTKSVALKEKDIEQNHLCFAFPAYGRGDPRMRALLVFNSILGDGMSSRLFQRLREELGLVYTVSSFVSAHEGAGLFMIYSAQQKSAEEQAAAVIIEELRKFKAEGVTEDDLLLAREQIKTGLVTGFESTYSRMGFNARDYMQYGRIRPVEELTAEIDAVGQGAIAAVIDDIIVGERLSVSVVGRLSEDGFYRRLLM